MGNGHKKNRARLETYLIAQLQKLGGSLTILIKKQRFTYLDVQK